MAGIVGKCSFLSCICIKILHLKNVAAMGLQQHFYGSINQARPSLALYKLST